MMPKRSYSRGGEMPPAMSRAFSQNPAAADRFMSLSSHNMQSMIDGSYSLYAYSNMPAYVDSCSQTDNNISYFIDQLYY